MSWEKGKPRSEETKKKMRKFDEIQEQEAIELYLSGLSANKVAIKMNCGDELIRRILIKHDIPRRSKSEAIKTSLSYSEVREKMSKSHTGVSRKPHSKETKEKISKARKREWSNPEYKSKQLDSTRSETLKKLWEDEQYIEKVLDGLSGCFEGRETSIEKIVREKLESLNVDFECQKVISRCIVDFYIPTGNKIIEADGDYWHNLKEVKERDKRKDLFLKSNGYKILRLSESEINSDPLHKIKSFLYEH